MNTSSTPLRLQDHYKQLYIGLKKGDLEACFENHQIIATNLRIGGAQMLSRRHRYYAEKVGRVIELLQVKSTRLILPCGAQNSPLAKIDYTGPEQVKQDTRGFLKLNDSSSEQLELRIIELLSNGKRTRKEILFSFFGAYSADLLSDRILQKLVDNINRHIARIIDDSSSCLSLKTVQF